MWALAEHVARIERQQWRRHFGTAFTGMHEGRPVRFRWHEQVTGHVCMGNIEDYGHLHCMQLVTMRWVFVRAKAESK